MEFKDIHIGMRCGSKKGCGTVTWVDCATQKVYLSDVANKDCFEVDISDIIDDPQVHNEYDDYY